MRKAQTLSRKYHNISIVLIDNDILRKSITRTEYKQQTGAEGPNYNKTSKKSG